MTIQHRPGVKHTNADALSQIPEEHDTNNCYEAGQEIDSLSCDGCQHYAKLHNIWGALVSEVDYVVPLATRQLEVSSDVNGKMAEDPTPQVICSNITDRNYKSARCKTLNYDP